MRAWVWTGTDRLAPLLRATIWLAAAINGAVGMAWLFAPEWGLPAWLWPSAVPPLLTRFIGAIVLANGVGAALIAWWGSWQSARVLFAVAWVYGVVVGTALLAALLAGAAAPLFWSYLAVDALFLLPISALLWWHERPLPRPAQTPRQALR